MTGLAYAASAVLQGCKMFCFSSRARTVYIA